MIIAILVFNINFNQVEGIDSWIPFVIRMLILEYHL